MTTQTQTPAFDSARFADYEAAARRARAQAVRDLAREAARAVRSLFSAPEAAPRAGLKSC